MADITGDKPDETIPTITTTVEAAPATDTRERAHYHPADKRANQHGKVVDGGIPTGREKQEPCYFANYTVRNPGGLMINEQLYQGRQRVPECVANQLSMMDREWEEAERNLFRNNSYSSHREVQNRF